MIYFLYLYKIIAFRDAYGYRIKLSGDEELYIAVVDTRLRLVKSPDLDKLDNLYSVAHFDYISHNIFEVRFCKDFMSAKRSDPGVIPLKKDDRSEDISYRRWELYAVDNGYVFKNNGKCLHKTDAYDESRRGFYVHARECENSPLQRFSVLNVGLIANFCKDDAKEFCRGRKNMEKRRYGDDYYDPEEDILENCDERYENCWPGAKRRRDDEFDRPRNKRRRRDPMDEDYESPYDGYPEEGISGESNVIDPGIQKTHHGRMTEHKAHHHRGRNNDDYY